MSGWFWIALVIATLLAVGAWTDWKRRHSGGGTGDTPGEARRDAQAGGHTHQPSDGGGMPGS